MKSAKKELVDYWRSSKLITDEAVIEAFLKIPREEFIPSHLVGEAYGDYPLPLFEGQTISQPTTVMIMTQALEPGEGQKILEIGAGSGYQAAILASIVGEKGHVYSVEIIPELAKFAKKNIEKVGINNVTVIQGDGGAGYEKEAPYDRIIVTAACPAIPKPLIEQLKDNGIMVAPIDHFLDQVMVKIRKRDGKLHQETLGHFRFVPLKGRFGVKP